MQCYTELTPPTAVTHAVNLPFISGKSNNLIVAKTSLLQIFQLKSIVTEAQTATNEDVKATAQDIAAGAGDRDDLTLQRTENTTKLVLVSEHILHGTVTALAKIGIEDSKSGGDALIVGFKDAKLSLIDWDPEYQSISTISIHLYESEDIQMSPMAPPLSQCHNYLAVDPSSRCAALKFGARHLAILPFRQPGDDLVEDDFAASFDGSAEKKEKAAVNGDGPELQTPYGKSFVLPLTALDPALTNPVHLDFLYEYREPTFGILSSSRLPATSLLPERKDMLSYTVFTLDVEERASTTLLSVTDLPYDLWKVVPLSLPVGGALLIGANQLVHVDQSGKTTGVAVNEFARQCSSFTLADQSDLALRLEGCSVDTLGADSSDLLVVLKSGELAIVSFRLDGRLVSNISVHRVTAEKGGQVVRSASSCIAPLGRNRMFLGSEDGDSVVLGWTKKAAQLSRKRSHAEMLGEDADLSIDEDESEDDDGDDDLYADEPVIKRQATSPIESGAPSNYTFRIHDRLLNLGPITDLILGAPVVSSGQGLKTANTSAVLELAAASGRGKASGVSIIKREIDPVLYKQYDMPAAGSIWSIRAKKPSATGFKTAPGEQDPETLYSVDAERDQYILIARGEESTVYRIADGELEETDPGNFESDAGVTVDVGTLAHGTRIAQVMKGEIRSFDS
ncbi:hypothetical protein LTS18_007253, partial [Coniosporium uncinatum]